MTIHGCTIFKHMHGCTIFKHLHDLRYDPIQFQIQYMDVTPSKFLNICMPWNISKYDLIQFQIQYMEVALSNSRTYAFPQIIVNQFQIPIHRVTIKSLFTYIEWHLLELKWPNPISNPIHGYWLCHFGHFWS